jgi:hypothetical protein
VSKQTKVLASNLRLIQDLTLYICFCQVCELEELHCGNQHNVNSIISSNQLNPTAATAGQAKR